MNARSGAWARSSATALADLVGKIWLQRVLVDVVEDRPHDEERQQQREADEDLRRRDCGRTHSGSDERKHDDDARKRRDEHEHRRRKREDRQQQQYLQRLRNLLRLGRRRYADVDLRNRNGRVARAGDILRERPDAPRARRESSRATATKCRTDVSFTPLEKRADALGLDQMTACRCASRYGSISSAGSSVIKATCPLLAPTR